jgi:hypothetical protein
VKKRFPFTCGICIRPFYAYRDSDREILDYLQKRLSEEEFAFFWNLPRNVHVPGSEERNQLPQGKHALPHALLRTDEIEEELLLHRGNRKTGSQEYLFPAFPALFRKALRKIYAERGRLFFEKEDRLVCIDNGDKSCFPMMRINGCESRRHIYRQMRQLRRRVQVDRSAAVIILNPATIETARNAASLLISLGTKFRFDTIELDELLQLPGCSTAPGSTEELPPFPLHPAQPLLTDPRSRFLREIPWDHPKESRLLRLTRVLRPDGNGEEEKECGTFPVPERSLIAHMPGDVEMCEQDVSAWFSRGEFAGLSLAGRADFLFSPSSAWIETSETRISSRRIGSFSFQNGSIRGLRDSCTFDSEEFSGSGRLVRDYFFVAGDNRLCISCFITFPDCRPGVEIKSYGLCEIPLHMADGLPQVDVHYPEEEASPIRIEHMETALLHGTGFSFSSRTACLSLVFADYQTRVKELPLALRDGVLRLNPGGSYRSFAGERVHGLQERFSMVLSLDPLSSSAGPQRPLAPLLPFLESHQICFTPQKSREKSVRF